MVDISLTLGTHRDVGDLAADSLFQIFHVIACFLGQVFPLAGCGDIAVPAGQVLHHGLCGVQSFAHGEAGGGAAIGQLVGSDHGDLFHVVQHVQQGQSNFIAATGRPRRVGPIDLVASRYGVFCQGCDEVALTLLDVLDYMEKIPMVTAYKLTDGSTTTRFPMGEALDTAQPVVEYLPGWHCDITAARKWEDLPKEARDYVEYLEKAVGCKITYISVGAEREAYIHHV